MDIKAFAKQLIDISHPYETRHVCPESCKEQVEKFREDFLQHFEYVLCPIMLDVAELKSNAMFYLPVEMIPDIDFQHLVREINRIFHNTGFEVNLRSTWSLTKYIYFVEFNW